MARGGKEEAGGRGMAFTLKQFIAESNRIEGINRTVLPKEVEAAELFLSRSKITVGALEQYVSTIQPGAILRDKTGLNVRVGNHYPPKGGPEIRFSLELLLANATGVRDAFKTHLDYETLHPFTDGNGRSGRILWLWMKGGIEKSPLGFLHHFYYDTLVCVRGESQPKRGAPWP